MNNNGRNNDNDDYHDDDDEIWWRKVLMAGKLFSDRLVVHIWENVGQRWWMVCIITVTIL
jgi:hypothetical protein